MKKKKLIISKIISFRFPLNLVIKIDRAVKKIKKAHPESKMSRTKYVILAIEDFMDYHVM